MSKYTFQTVVVAAETREAFTSLREELNASDKALFEAIWQTLDIDKVKEKLAEVKPLFGRKKKAVAAADVQVTDEQPLADETPIEKIARKAAKKAAKKKVEPAPKADDDNVVVVVEEEQSAE